MVANDARESRSVTKPIVADDFRIVLVVELAGSGTAAQGPGRDGRVGRPLGTAIVQDPGKFSCSVLHARGGRIPAPLQSYRN